MINLSGERNWKTIFFFLNSQFMTLFFNDFHWKCMNINGSKKFPLLTHANRILFFLVLQFIKGICSFFFISFFPFFIQWINTFRIFQGYRVTRNLIHGGSRCCYILPVHVSRRIWSIDILMKHPRQEWYRFYITFKRHISSTLESKFNLYSLNFSILFSNTFSITVSNQKFLRELFLFLQLLVQIY